MKLTKAQLNVLSYVCSHATLCISARTPSPVARARRSVLALKRLGLVNTHARGDNLYVVATKEGLNVCKTLTQDSAASSQS